MKNERKVKTSYAVSTVSLALVLFLLSAVGCLTWIALGVGRTLQESTVVTVEVKEENDSLKQMFVAEPLVREVRFSSKAEKLADPTFREAFGQDFEAILGENPLPDSYELSLTAASSDRLRLDSLIMRLDALSGVEGVYYPVATTERIHAAVAQIRLVLLLFGGALLVISLILLHNTIRLTIAARRNVIHTMRLVGASRAFILRPLLGRSALQGLFAGLIATGLLWLSWHGLSTVISMGSIEIVHFVAVTGVLIAAGILLSTTFTLIASRKIISK